MAFICLPRLIKLVPTHVFEWIFSSFHNYSILHFELKLEFDERLFAFGAMLLCYKKLLPRRNATSLYDNFLFTNLSENNIFRYSKIHVLMRNKDSMRFHVLRNSTYDFFLRRFVPLIIQKIVPITISGTSPNIHYTWPETYFLYSEKVQGFLVVTSLKT